MVKHHPETQILYLRCTPMSNKSIFVSPPFRRWLSPVSSATQGALTEASSAEASENVWAYFEILQCLLEAVRVYIYIYICVYVYI